MSRLDGPFPFGIGSGSSTSSEIVCEFCGKVHNEGYDVDRDGKEGDSVPNINFMGKQMAGCCFKTLEKNIFRWKEDIAAWLDELSKASRDQATQDELTALKINDALETLKKHEGP